jgi:hypothetical protein
LARNIVRVLGWEYALSASGRNVSVSLAWWPAAAVPGRGLFPALPGDSRIVNGQQNRSVRAWIFVSARRRSDPTHGHGQAARSPIPAIREGPLCGAADEADAVIYGSLTELESHVSVTRACDLLGLVRASVYRVRAPRMLGPRAAPVPDERRSGPDTSLLIYR